MAAAAAGNTVWLETVKRSEKNVEADVKAGDEPGELGPSQAQQPSINVAPSPGVRINFDEFDLTGTKRNLTACASHFDPAKLQHGHSSGKDRYLKNPELCRKYPPATDRAFFRAVLPPDRTHRTNGALLGYAERIAGCNPPCTPGVPEANRSDASRVLYCSKQSFRRAD